MGKFIAVFLLLVVLAGAGVAVWWLTHPATEPTELILYGNVDLRQAQLAFNNSERIKEVKVREGSRVNKGDELASLDTGRLKPLLDQAKAKMDDAYAAYLEQKNGSRPEEIAQARARVLDAQAVLTKARDNYNRIKPLLEVKLSDKSVASATSKEDVDNAKTTLDSAEQTLIVQQKSLDMSVIGPRKEKIDQAFANYEGLKANLAYLQAQFDDSVLKAPNKAIVRSRLMEPGEMASPQKAVFSLALIEEKWVRAYVAEPELGKIREQMKANVSIDSYPNKSYEGYIKFISSVAEFTPKTVQTVDLRTSLVYEVRIYVSDEADELRLGMPATIRIPLK